MKKVKKKMGPTNNSGANTPKTGIFQHVWHSIELFTESHSDFVGLLCHWRIYPKQIRISDDSAKNQVSVTDSDICPEIGGFTKTDSFYQS